MPGSFPIRPVGAALLSGAGPQRAPPPARETRAVAQLAPPPPAPAPAPPPAEAPPPRVEITPISIYFAFDSADLSQDARTALMGFSSQAQMQKDVDLRIEGNCDERGTREYN